MDTKSILIAAGERIRSDLLRGGSAAAGSPDRLRRDDEIRRSIRDVVNRGRPAVSREGEFAIAKMLYVKGDFIYCEAADGTPFANGIRPDAVAPGIYFKSARALADFRQRMRKEMPRAIDLGHGMRPDRYAGMEIFFASPAEWDELERLLDDAERA